jgi:hypothetical protein
MDQMFVLSVLGEVSRAETAAGVFVRLSPAAFCGPTQTPTRSTFSSFLFDNLLQNSE